MRTITPQNLTCSPAERKLLDFIQDNEAAYLANALREIHDMALYHSEIPIEETEKTHLLHVKLLADELEKISSKFSVRSS
jgi:hypothetical protein